MSLLVPFCDMDSTSPALIANDDWLILLGLWFNLSPLNITNYAARMGQRSLRTMIDSALNQAQRGYCLNRAQVNF